MEILESRNDLKPLQRIDILRSECYAENFVEHWGVGQPVPEKSKNKNAIF
ncbi:hypothetical protein GCM10007877_13070 [Marinibactrum halimedae]|uniref:Uncharacterized protein n=1 Tax=Marinibactrum halimedae TaxID=1444977 RepID=A0AA37WLF6_9GAMM|nr:hypothetical protein GCM10007877_13070 [Marinibactrum halimedae]